MNREEASPPRLGAIGPDVREETGGKQMRMHEILGVEPGELFEHLQRGLFYFVDSAGAVRECPDKDANNWRHNHAPGHVISSMINLPDGIIRKPRLTAEQVAELKALATLGLRYTTKSRIGQIISHGNKPRKMETHWASERSINEPGFIHVNKVLGNLVSWSDPEPLDIVQTLKNAGVEV